LRDNQAMRDIDDAAFRRSLSSVASGLAARVLVPPEGPFVIAIDGPGCCGKSTLAELLLEHLDAAVLSTDDFHEPSGHAREAHAPLPYRRWSALCEAVDLLAHGNAATLQPIDWSDASLGPVVTIEARHILVVDGIGSLHPDIAGRANLKVWVDGHARNRMQRTTRREGRDMSVEWAPYVPLEQSYFATYKPWRNADVFVLGAQLHWGNVTESFALLIEAGVPAA
jgi:uridine kinase